MLKINNSVVRFMPALALAAILCFNLGLAKSAAAPSKTAAAHAHHLLANPHLHGARAAIARSERYWHLARYWRGRWVFTDWAVLHRGLGTIEGEVRNANGSPMAGVRVALRSSKGRIFGNVAARHVTSTNAAGIFTMWHVRIGSYRVRATKGKAVGATPVHVSGGPTALVSVRI